MTSFVIPLHVREGVHRSPPSRQPRRRSNLRKSGGGERLPGAEFPEERTKTVVAALLLFASSLCTSLSLSFLNEVVPRDRPLPDVVFKLIPIQEWAWPVSDILVITMASVCGVSMLLHRYRWIVMRRTFLIASVLYFCRSLAMMVTWAPLSDRSMLNKCVTPMAMRRTSAIDSISSTIAPTTTIAAIPWSMIGLRMWQYGISLGFYGVEANRVLCGDYIYSGHTLMYVLTTLIMRTYMPRRGVFRLLRYLYPIAALAGMLFVTISRLHYTIDVVVAYWMTTLTFWCYHLLIALPRPSTNNRLSADDRKMTNRTESTTILIDDPDEETDSEEENNNNRNRLNRLFYNYRSFNLFGSRYVLEYFEKNIPPGSTIPRELKWPFEKPVCVGRFLNGMNEISNLSNDD